MQLVALQSGAKKRKKAEEKAQVAAAKIAGLLEGELLEEVVAAHRRVLGGLRGPPPPPPPPPAGSLETPAAAAAAAKDPSGWWAAAGRPPAPARYGRVLDPEEAVRAVAFVRAYDVGVAVTRAAGLAGLPQAVDAAAATGHLLRAALEHACVSRPALPIDKDTVPMIHRIGATSKPDAGGKKGDAAAAAAAGAAVAAGAVSAGAELALAGDIEVYDPAADAAADALGADLNEGGCAGEMHLVVAPVAAVRKRLQTLLDEWPGHPLLEQLAEICERVLALPLLSPLKQALTGLELLLARAQTWEEGAALHVSLSDELTACAKLALRWRQRELRTWPRLLARAAERHVARAHRTWFALHRLLRPPVTKKQKRAAAKAARLEREAAGDFDDGDGYDDVGDEMEEVDDGIDASGLTEEEREGLRQVTMALEEYIQGSTIGEFRARLDLLWQFHADLSVEARAAAAAAAAAGDDAYAEDAAAAAAAAADGDDDAFAANAAASIGAREAALANVLYNTWRYYVQFLPAVSRRVEAARAPAAQKLRDHAKVGLYKCVCGTTKFFCYSAQRQLKSLNSVYH
jgi:hypothetical protein